MRIREPFSHVREWPPLTPKRTQGALPLDPAHWQFVARRAARAAQCRCGVHGFAMNPYCSLPLAHAPYYRGARVTFARRQTACEMRHCCARRIVETGGRRKLGCTSTRWAERQRIIEAEANRIAMLTRQRRARGTFTSETSELFKPETANPRPFSWGFKGGILFCERESPL